jgi:hypothetical protein
MSLHDEYARITPFELAFRDRASAESLVKAVDEESAGRGADIEAPHAFVTMGAVAAFVRGIEGPEAPPGAIHQYGALAFHGVHFMKASCPLYLLTTHVARCLVEGSPGRDATPPSSAGYLQLPQHLFWSSDGGPQSIDGIFWTTTRGGALHTLMATGVRTDRSGLGVVPLPEAPMRAATDWLTMDVRGDGSDFASELPGAELDHLYELQSSGEVFKILVRFFAYAADVPQALEAHPPASQPHLSTPQPARGNASTSPSPVASALPYVRVLLTG